MTLPDFMDVGKEMGDLIRKRRIELKLTKAQVAKRADISVSRLEDIEKGKGRISLTKVCALSKALDMYPHTLLSC
ncbi:MAG TPA: helix-turn-helix transcriptional regulator [Elusimicrobiales bacterium]|nr:helix-turn-helix transcriptional regulator [Elusimicrobiales bacterium]